MEEKVVRLGDSLYMKIKKMKSKDGIFYVDEEGTNWIIINSSLPFVEKVITLVHELIHYYVETGRIKVDRRVEEKVIMSMENRMRKALRHFMKELEEKGGDEG